MSTLTTLNLRLDRSVYLAFDLYRSRASQADPHFAAQLDSQSRTAQRAMLIGHFLSAYLPILAAKPSRIHDDDPRGSTRRSRGSRCLNLRLPAALAALLTDSALATSPAVLLRAALFHTLEHNFQCPARVVLNLHAYVNRHDPTLFSLLTAPSAADVRATVERHFEGLSSQNYAGMPTLHAATVPQQPEMPLHAPQTTEPLSPYQPTPQTPPAASNPSTVNLPADPLAVPRTVPLPFTVPDGASEFDARIFNAAFLRAEASNADDLGVVRTVVLRLHEDDIRALRGITQRAAQAFGRPLSMPKTLFFAAWSLYAMGDPQAPQLRDMVDGSDAEPGSAISAPLAIHASQWAERVGTLCKDDDRYRLTSLGSITSIPMGLRVRYEIQRAAQRASFSRILTHGLRLLAGEVGLRLPTGKYDSVLRSLARAHGVSQVILQRAALMRAVHDVTTSLDEIPVLVMYRDRMEHDPSDGQVTLAARSLGHDPAQVIARVREAAMAGRIPPSTVRGRPVSRALRVPASPVANPARPAGDDPFEGLTGLALAAARAQAGL